MGNHLGLSLLFHIPFLFLLSAHAQNTYELTEPLKTEAVSDNGILLGGKSPSGGSIAVNNFYISQNGKPFIPIMGEFHYCRFPKAQWKEELLKMKAGGINTVSTYVFWNIHEPHEGEFHWDGNLDLRYFTELCQQVGLQVIVRIGPFDHGEIRNGGLPDWLYAKPVNVRSNDELYLYYAEILFEQIGNQLEGLYYKDGGPIIGIQIENEHQHAASTWALAYMGHSEYTTADYDQAFAHFQISPDERKITTARLGEEHMLRLKAIAHKYGMDVPLYTATGWGNAATLGKEGIPVMAAYQYATWGRATDMSPYCLFTDLRNTPDYSPVRFNPKDFPSIYAEMGSGIQMTYSSRPYVEPQGVYTMLLRSLGSGSNGFGYYMYHGGSSPKMEDGANYFSDGDGFLPRISYDFQAPIGEAGIVRESYKRMRMLHLFMQDFQDVLAPMETVIPDNQKTLQPSDRDNLRYAARMKDGSGFLFLINFQDHDSLRHDMKGLSFKLNLKDGELRIPASGSMTLPKDKDIVMPFNLDMDGALLKYATAQLLMKIDDDGHEHYFFFVPDGVRPEFCFDKFTVKGKNLYQPHVGFKGTFSVKTAKGREVFITVLDEWQAMNATKIDGRLLVTSSTVVSENGQTTLLNLDNPEFKYVLYPSKAGMKEQVIRVTPVNPSFQVKKFSDRLLTIHFKDSVALPQVKEYFLKTDYTADVAMAFLGNELIDDDFWHGEPWMIALDRFKSLLMRDDITMRFRPLKKGNPCIETLRKSVVPVFTGGDVLKVDSVKVIPQYQVRLP